MTNLLESPRVDDESSISNFSNSHLKFYSSLWRNSTMDSRTRRGFVNPLELSKWREK